MLFLDSFDPFSSVMVIRMRRAFRSRNRTAGITFYSFRLLLACVASVSVGLVLPARKMVREPFFARQKHRKSRSLVFLCSQTPRKRLLRRLTLVVAILFLFFFLSVYSFSKIRWGLQFSLYSHWGSIKIAG